MAEDDLCIPTPLLKLVLFRLCMHIGRVRASNLHEVVTAIKLVLCPNSLTRRYVHPSHRTVAHLLVDLPLSKDDSKKAGVLQQRGRQAWRYVTQTEATPESAATHILSSLDSDQVIDLQERLHKALFAFHQGGTTSIPQLRDGVLAEVEIKKRILQDGINLPHPLTNEMQLAHITHEIDGDCLIGQGVPELSGRPDLSGTATFPDGTKQDVILEIKHYKNPLSDWRKATPATRYQLNTYALLAAELTTKGDAVGQTPTVYLLQADSSTNTPDTTPGTHCKLMEVIRVDADVVFSEWTGWYCRLARAILLQITPWSFEVGANVAVTSSKQAVVPRVNTRTKRKTGCPAYLPSLRYHVHHSDAVNDVTGPPGKDSGTWYNLRTGFYFYGEYNLSHNDHKAVSSTANAKRFSKEETMDVYDSSVKVGITPRMLTSTHGISTTKARNLLNAVSQISYALSTPLE